MSAPRNQAAWLHEVNTALRVREAPMPVAGSGEIVVKNAAVAINPLDWHQQDFGVFIQQWPTIFGCDVAGEVHEVGPDVHRLKKGDRVIGHAVGAFSGRPLEGAFALYTIVPEKKATVLPDQISFVDGVVVPFAVEAAVCALSVKVPGPSMPGVTTPALGLPLPTLQGAVDSATKCLVVYGASSSTGSMTTQIATAAGIKVIGIASRKNAALVSESGAIESFDHKDDHVVEKVVAAVKATDCDFVGIFDAISTAETYVQDLAILEQLGGGHLACTHPPPTEDMPSNVKSGMIFACDHITASVYEHFLTAALSSGQLKCLPQPTVVGKGLQHVNEALKMSKAGVSGTKLVVEL